MPRRPRRRYPILREPRPAEVRYLRDLRRVWAVSQAIIAAGLDPLLRLWPAEPPREDRAAPRRVATRTDSRDLRLDTPAVAGRYNPLIPPPRLPRIWNLTDADLRRLWPSIDPDDIREYAPWAVTRAEVSRIVFPGQELPGTDERLEQYVRRAIESERAARPRPPGRPVRPNVPRGPDAFILRPRTMPPVIIGPGGLPMVPPMPTVISTETIRQQLGWCELALGEVVTTENLSDVTLPVGQDVSRWVRREHERVLSIDLRADVPGLQAQIDQWRGLNVDLIESGVRAADAAPQLRPSLLADVSRTVEEAHREGLRVEVLANQLRQRFGVSDSRAELIARDQVLKLNGQITRSRQQAAGITHYRWITSRDERVRETHQALDETIQSWDAPPEVAPGRNEHPGSDFSCRCTASPVLPADDDD